MIVVFRKHRRRNLPAQIAVDAGVVDKKRSGDILGIGALRIRHITIVGEIQGRTRILNFRIRVRPRISATPGCRS